MNKISVIIPCYNHEKFIGRCLRSILDQSLDRKEYEIIIIDDGSTDNSLKISKAFGKQVRIIENKQNRGLPYSLNAGIKSSKSKYIVRLDSDDYVNKNFLLSLLQFVELNSSRFDAAECDYLIVNDKERVISRENCLKKPIACGIIFKTSHLKKIGFYNEKFLLNEEIELRRRFEKKYKIARLELPLYRYRKHLKNITNKKKFMKKFSKLLKENEK